MIPERKKKALRSTAGIIQASNTGLDKKQINYLVKLMDAGDDAEFRQVYGKYNILNYLNILRSRQLDLKVSYSLDKQTKTNLNYVRTEQEVQDLNLNVNTIYFVTSTNIYPHSSNRSKIMKIREIFEDIMTSTFDSDFVTKAKNYYNKGDHQGLINHIAELQRKSKQVNNKDLEKYHADLQLEVAENFHDEDDIELLIDMIDELITPSDV